MYLLDTNIFLEGLLDQERAGEVKALFQRITLDKIFISDLTLNSIGIILFKLNQKEQFNIFLDSTIQRGLEILSLDIDNISKIKDLTEKHNLDFESAYQLLLALKHELQLISFNKEYDRIGELRKEPKDII